MNEFNKREELSFSDSWKEKSVELAATGAIVAAAGSLAVKGNIHDSLKYGKQALKQSHKGFENYIKRRSNPVTRLLYNTGKKTFNNLSKEPKLDSKSVLEMEIGKSKAVTSGIKESDVISLAASKQSKLESEQKHLLDTAKALNQEVPKLPEIDPIRLQEEARQELFETGMKPKPVGGNRFIPKKDENKNFEKARAEFVGGALTGLGLGAGVTAFHAIDKATRSEKNKKKDQSFEIAGTFIPQNRRKEGNGYNMKKEAGYREVYDGLAGLGKKVPQAAATGVGFTGVSLGTAEMLKKQREKESENVNKQNRIIIEFGADDPVNKDDGAHASMGRMGFTARPNLNKEANLKSFLKNVGGRSSEKAELDRRLQDFDYQSAAADSLKTQDAPNLAKKRYGHLLGDEKAGEKLLEEETKKLRNVDVNAKKQIGDDVAKSRLIAGGSLGLAGLGVGGANHMTKNKREDELNG